jgi:hypothetical protein
MTLDIAAQQYDVVDVNDLQPHPNNPRRGDVDAISESIDAHGFYGALVVQRSTGYVLAGNHRLQAARAQSIARVPVIFVDVDDDAARRILLVDNRTNDLAEYDDAQLVDVLRLLEGDLSGTGYSDNDLIELLAADDGRRFMEEDGEQERIEDDFGVYDRETIIDAAVTWWHEHRDFPYRSLSLSEQMQQLNRLAQTEDTALRHSVAAYQVADTYHPHRYEVRIPGKRNPVESFHDDRLLRQTVMLIVDSGMIVTKSTMLNALAMVRNTQAAANFRPGFALLMLRRFASPGATVLDTSTGYGGRLLGYAASKCSAYIGIDPNRQTHDANQRMTDALSIKGVELICAPAEDVPHEQLAERADFAFTSPPYFTKEQYSNDDTQSWVRYGSSGEAWRDGFLIKMLALQYAALRRGAHSVVNIADVKVGSKKYPLLDWTIDGAQQVGFELVGVERFPVQRVPGRGNREDKYEPLVVLRKG